MNEKEHEEKLKRLYEEVKKNMEDRPIMKIMREEDARKANNRNDKLITKEEVERQIRANYPEQTKYWLGNGRGKHTAIDVAVKCSKCDCQGIITIEDKCELRDLLKEKCLRCEMWEDAENAHLNIRLPFGKFRGKTINVVMKKQPSYLAWFVDKVKGEDALVEKIKTHTRFPQAWADYVGKQAVIVPKARREAMEWHEGRFSQQTIDELFNSFYGEQNPI
jgi:hypothetical protein